MVNAILIIQEYVYNHNTGERYRVIPWWESSWYIILFAIGVVIVIISEINKRQ